MNYRISLIIIVLALSMASFVQSAPDNKYYLDANQSFESRVDNLVSQMTLEEKVSQMGINSPAIERLSIKKYYWWNECLHGVWLFKSEKCETVFPSAISFSSTWNPDLINKVADAISDEARAFNKLGINDLTYWSPVINIMRDPRWGRTNETYSEDPYLTGRIGVAYVKGLQGNDPKYFKVISTPKHFAVNNEEFRRHYGDVKVDEKQLMEYYLPQFKDCVIEGKAGSVMAAYNSVNGVPCPANTTLLQDILRNTWGFDGYVVSDCGAIDDILNNHHYVATAPMACAVAVKAGCDIDCGDAMYQKNLVQAVKEKLISEDYINTSVKRLFMARFKLGEFDPPQMVPYTKITEDVIDSPAHRQLALETARQSIVLLKNKNNLLPLDKNKLKRIAIIGPSLDFCEFGGYSGKACTSVTPLQGIKTKLNSQTEVCTDKGCTVTGNLVPVPSEYFTPPNAKEGEHGLKAEYFNNPDCNGTPALVRIDKDINFNWKENSPDPTITEKKFSVRWTGKLTAPQTANCLFQVLTQYDATKLYIDDKLIVKPNPGTKAAIAYVDLKAGNQYDIRMEYTPHGKKAYAALRWNILNKGFTLEKNVAENIGKADVVIAIVDSSLDNEGVDRIDLDLPAPQEDMIKEIYKINPKTIVVLVNGSPLSIKWTAQNVPAIVEAWFGGEQGGTAIADVLFGDYNPSGKLPVTFYESVKQLPPFDDYDITKGRTYMYLKEKPLFPFGYGLSYTKFEYSNLKISAKSFKASDVIRVYADIKNTGSMAGDEIVQLYVRHLDSNMTVPIKQLRRFQGISIPAGQTKNISFELPVEELAFYDVSKKQFEVHPGGIELMLGSSSDDIRLKGNINIMK